MEMDTVRPDAATSSMKRTSAKVSAGALLGGGVSAWKPLQMPVTRGLDRKSSSPVHGLGEAGRLGPVKAQGTTKQFLPSRGKSTGAKRIRLDGARTMVQLGLWLHALAMLHDSLSRSKSSSEQQGVRRRSRLAMQPQCSGADTGRYPYGLHCAKI